MTKRLNKNNILFVNFISGIKVIPLNTLILMINDILNNSIKFTFNINGDKIMKLQ